MNVTATHSQFEWRCILSIQSYVLTYLGCLIVVINRMYIRMYGCLYECTVVLAIRVGLCVYVRMYVHEVCSQRKNEEYVLNQVLTIQVPLYSQ